MKKYKIVCFTEVSAQWDNILNEYVSENKEKLKGDYELEIIDLSSPNRDEYPDDVGCIELYIN